MSAATYLDMLVGAEPDDSYLELRWRLPNGRGMGREFHPVRQPRLATLIAGRGRSTDLYAGVAPRVRQEGTRDAVARLHVLWADLDAPEAIERLEAFGPPPSLVVGSGSGRHVYWALWPPASPDEAESANHRLAHALGGDGRATDAARVLRPPGTFNFKTGAPMPVRIEHAESAIYSIEEVVGRLPEPLKAKRERRPSMPPFQNADDPLQAIPPDVYVEALTGLEVGRDGKVCCPLHQDRTPSLHAYGLEKGWYCFGCEQGGTIIDFGALLYGITPRGARYQEIRRRLASDLLTRAA